MADIPRRFAPGVEPLEGLPARARRLGIGCYRARALEGETRKQSPLAELPTVPEREALAGRTGLAPRRMVLYCEYAWVIEKRARTAADLLARHGAAFRLFAGRDGDQAPLQTLGWALHGARYAGMQVEGFDAAEGILRFSLELLCREARRAE